MPLEVSGVAGSRSPLRREIRSLLQHRLPIAWEWLGSARAIGNRMLARRARRLVGTYIGVTGSCGKSTATHLIGELLDGEGRVRSALHQNSLGGVFMALAGLRQRVDYFVQEIGGGTPGRMDTVLPVLRPDIAVVTTVGHDHFASFKDQLADLPGDVPVMDRYLELIAREKGKLVAGLAPAGTACLNADQELVREMAARCAGRVVLYGTHPDSEVRAESIDAVWPGRLAFDLVVAGQRRHIETQFAGTLVLGTILAALAVVHAVGGDLDRAAERLLAVQPLLNRASLARGPDGRAYLLDTIKAPLWQVEALIEDLPNLKAPSLVFVLGEISDVRTDKSKTYRRLLRRASEVADHVVGFGPSANSANKVRGEGRDNVVGIETYEQAARYLAQLPSSLVVLKSSKALRMERILEAVAPGSSSAATPSAAAS